MGVIGIVGCRAARYPTTWLTLNCPTVVKGAVGDRSRDLGAAAAILEPSGHG